MGDCRKGTVIAMIYDHQPQQILIVSPNSVMLAKFETKSSRVKGIALHPKRPWVLCSLHDGQIQLWDYRVGTLLETFKEHNGPVRSVDFHCSQPLFVSGGDDYKIRVWNYNSKRSLYTLMGHKDYIRGVQFHTQNPWIVSCSDDQSIRIWNWQSRECIAVLQGHNHYVMSVQFHMTQDLVVSASLDQTIRVWDISALKQKGKTVPGLNPVPATVMGRFGIDNVATVKYILEGHERGVNWASFHHELPLIVSGSDDRMIKIWRTNESKAWEVDTMRGHTNNVNCVLFHPHEDLILSVSEDHSIRVWDSTKRICNQTFMRTRDRFWCLATHPTKNCVAAGHDSGAVVFKLSRERTPADVLDARCFYVLNRGYQMCDMYSGKNQTTIMQITRGAALSASEPRELMVNPFSSSEYMILVFNRSNGGSYEMVRFPQNSSGRIIPEVVSGNALGAAFIGRAKFATLESNDTLFVRNADNIVTKRLTLPVGGVSRLFCGGSAGRVLLQSGEELLMFDTSSQQLEGSFAIGSVKRVKWRKDGEEVAVITSNGLSVLDRSLSRCVSAREHQRVKGVVWDAAGVAIYCTMSQVKYLLRSGEQGVIRSLEDVVYPLAIRNGVLIGIDRLGKRVRIELDTTEYLLKEYLEERNYREAIRIIQHSHIDSQAICSYLQRNGFEDIALHFVTEPRARFTLAIRCGNLEIALQCARELDLPDIWNSLAEEALKQGNHEIVEMAYQHTKAFDKLSFLYVITGNMEKLRKMLRIAELRNDIMGRCHNALFLGDVGARISLLREVGQPSLAYLTAVTHGLDDVAQQIYEELQEEGCAIPAKPRHPSLLVPPVAVLQESNWPLLEMPRSQFDKLMDEMKASGDDVASEAASFDESGSYSSSMESVESEGSEEFGEGVDASRSSRYGKAGGGARSANQVKEIELSEDSEAENPWSDDLDFEEEDSASEEAAEVPVAASSLPSQWCRSSSLAVDHVAAGDIDGAVQLLHRQIGLLRVSSLAAPMRRCFLAVQATTAGFPGMPTLETPLQREGGLPRTILTLSDLRAEAKKGLKSFQGARFEDCAKSFREVFEIAPFVQVGDRGEESELAQYLDLAREYIIAVRLEQARQKAKKDAALSLLYLALMTRCKLQTAHLLLPLHSAMVASFKAENFIDAADYARRILENAEIKSPRNASLEQKAKKVLGKSEKEGRNAIQTGLLDDPFVVECATLAPLYRQEERVQCPYCHANYGKDAKQAVCSICELCQVGIETVGIVCANSQLLSF